MGFSANNFKREIMLQSINDKAKGWVAYLIVGFIAIPFTLFGIGSYLGGSDSLVAAVVNGEEIPVQEVQNSVVQQRQRLTQMFGGKLPPNFNDDTMKRQALEQIVSRTLIRQESAKHGYRASNQEVFDTIANIGAFQKDGKFDVATYEKLLVAQRRNKSDFEAEIRESISNQQFSQALSKAAFLPVNELTRYGKLENQTRSIESYTLKKEAFKPEIEVSEDELKSYYDTNASKYMTAEKVKVSYVELKQSHLAKDVSVSDEDLQVFYDENIGRYTDPEQRKLAHILIKIDDKAEDQIAAEQTALDRAQSLYDQIKSGSKTFEELATSSSDDAFSAKKSGEIGFVAKGDMGPLFEGIAFGLPVGDVSKPVKAEAGFEIVKVLELKEAKKKTFEQVKAEIEKVVRSEKSEKLFFDSSEKLQTLAFENDSSLDEAADSVGLKVQTSDWIVQGASSSKDLLASPKLIAAAFNDQVINQGKNSDLLEIDSETVAVIRVNDHEKPKQKPLTQVSDSIKSVLTDQKLRKLLIKKGEETLKSLQDKGDWSVLTSLGGSADDIVKLDAVKRNDNKVVAALRNKIFSMQKPSDGKPSFDSTILPNGEYVLIGLSKVTDGESKVDDEALQSRFAQMLGSREQSAMMKALREEAEVELFLDNIQ